MKSKRKESLNAEPSRHSLALIPETAVCETVHSANTSIPSYFCRAYFDFMFEVRNQPRSQHCPCGKPGGAHKDCNVIRSGVKEYVFEVFVRISFSRYRKRSADLHSIGSKCNHFTNFFW